MRLSAAILGVLLSLLNIRTVMTRGFYGVIVAPNHENSGAEMPGRIKGVSLC
jgi:hypothetical protein